MIITAGALATIITVGTLATAVLVSAPATIIGYCSISKVRKQRKIYNVHMCPTIYSLPFSNKSTSVRYFFLHVDFVSQD